jgi:hypothetical protein
MRIDTNVRARAWWGTSSKMLDFIVFLDKRWDQIETELKEIHMHIRGHLITPRTILTSYSLLRELIMVEEQRMVTIKHILTCL